MNTAICADTVSPRCETALDAGWRFQLGDIFDGWRDEGIDDGCWEEVRLPHDWAIAQPFDPAIPQGDAQGFQRRAHVGWYRRRVQLPPQAGRRTWLRLDGAYRHGRVWVNGHDLGVRPSGYATRIHDVTAFLRPDGRQLIAVRCDNTGHDADRWYSGAGLHRRVWLTTAGDVAVEPWGVAITTPAVTAESARVAVAVTVRNHRTVAVEATLQADLVAPDGAVVACRSVRLALAAGAVATASLEAALASPALWSPETPSLHAARIAVVVGGTVCDQVDQAFGVRFFSLTAEGFSLNGRMRKMQGVCLHHDLGCLGAAAFAAGWERRLRVLKDLGCDAIRTSHNPADPAFLDLCDRLGFVVISEAFDKWEGGCSGPFFKQWWQQDLAAMVLRDRNHPSIILWSVGNEVEHQGEADMIAIAARLAAETRRLDPTRPVMMALEPHCQPAEMFRTPVAIKVARTVAIAKHFDVLGCNYSEQWYGDYHAAMPDMPIIGSEIFHYWRWSENASWALNARNPWSDVTGNEYVLGGFLWTGIDYLGEAARGWPCRGWTGAMIDSAGFIKPRAWWHAAAWSAAPVVRIALRHRDRPALERDAWGWPDLIDHWNPELPQGEILEAWIFANTDSVELLHNGESISRRRPADWPNRIVVFPVMLKPGSLLAIGRDAAGNEVVRHELKTAGPAAKLVLATDRERLAADGQDLAHVTIEVVDAQGVRVPSARIPVGVEVQGAARLLAMDSGDLTSAEPYQTNSRHTLAGRCLAVLRSGMMAGEVRITAVSQGIPLTSLTLRVL